MATINDKWVFGQNAGVDFSTSSPTVFNSGISTSEGCASISDSSGNLIFYTDGVSIFDANGISKDSTLLGHDSSTQSAIIVPNPGSSDEYYVFTTDGSSHGSAHPNPPWHHFHGVLVNVNSWQVTHLPNSTFPSTVDMSPTERLVSVQLENCCEYWVITAVQIGVDGPNPGDGLIKGMGKFRIFKVSANGVSHHMDIDLGLELTEIGQMKISPDKKYIAIANGLNSWGSNTYNPNGIIVCPFDNATGLIDVTATSIKVTKIPITKTNHTVVYGLEFSPDSSLLYYGNLVSSSRESSIYQIDLSLNNITSNLVAKTLNSGNYGNGYYLCAFQLGPDGIIYIAQDQSQFLSAILNPNVQGAACNYVFAHLRLAPGSLSKLGLPNLVEPLCEKCFDTDKSCCCNSCDRNAEENERLLNRRASHHLQQYSESRNCPEPTTEICEFEALSKEHEIKPCFYLRWGEDPNEKLKRKSCKVMYLTACNHFKDVIFKGLRIESITLVSESDPDHTIQIVPDRLICFDCLDCCSCKSREITAIVDSKVRPGAYEMKVDYCFDEVCICSPDKHHSETFAVELSK